MLIYGKQTLLYYLKNFSENVEKIYIAKKMDKKEYNYLMGFKCEVERIPHDYAQKISKSANHQGYLAIVRDQVVSDNTKMFKSDFLLILCGITDMGNIGSILRSAYALGVKDVAISGIKDLNFTILAKRSSGASFSLNLYIITNIYDIINELRLSKFTLYGSDIEGDNLLNGTFEEKKALFIGSEDTGLGNRILSKLDKTYSITMHNGFNSLNVSSATSIFLYRMGNE